MKRRRSKEPQKSRAIGIRLNLEEMAALEKIKADHDIPTNTLAIRVLLRRAGGLLEPEPGVVAAWRGSGKALVKIGVNINQIARAANQGGVIWDKADDGVLLDLRKECLKIAGLLARLIATSRNRRRSARTMEEVIAKFGDGSSLADMPSVHPGEILQEEFLIPMGLTPGDLAERVGVPVEIIEQLVSKRARISPKMALRLSHCFGNTPEFWLNLQQRYDLAQIRADTGVAHILDGIEPMGV